CLSPCVSLFFLLRPPPPSSTLFPYTTLFRSSGTGDSQRGGRREQHEQQRLLPVQAVLRLIEDDRRLRLEHVRRHFLAAVRRQKADRKSTRLNSSHRTISYAVFCLKKKKKKKT